MGTAPAELAALVAREVDEGVASALTALDAGGALVLETVIARVAAPGDHAAPAGKPVRWDAVTWAAEMVLRVDPSSAQRRQGERAEPRVPTVIAALPVGAVRGVGPAWAGRLTSAGVTTVGALATAGPAQVSAWAHHWGSDALALAARARGCAVTLPESAATLGAGHSVLDLARSDPAGLPGDRLERVALWQAATTLAGGIDATVLGGIPAPELARA
jgi:predicted flap endonuclease-1-like 5' DNA nuclease